MLKTACFMLLLWGNVALAQQPMPVPPALKFIPDKIESNVGKLIKLYLTAEAKQIIWDFPDGLETDVSEDGKKAILVAPVDYKSGDYKIKVYAVVAEKIVKGECVLTIKGPPPPKPPETGLLIDLRRAYSDDGSDLESVNDLVKLFTLLQGYCDDKTITDVGLLMDTAYGAKEKAFEKKPNALIKVRARLNQELKLQITEGPDTAMNDNLRLKIKGVFTQIVDVLKTLATKDK